MINQKRIAVVIPCYKVSKQISAVLQSIPSFVDHILLVDDCCPESSGTNAAQSSKDPRITLIQHSQNKGVGGAVISGFKRSLELQCDVAVKIDGDGQMPTDIMRHFILPILNEDCDYTKGNRFFWPSGLRSMPLIRKIGNTGLSFLSKLSSGYWNIMDPTNGYTAIGSATLKRLELDKISERYFFESDMLFRLGIIRAVVRDIPMNAVYGDEESNLRISHSLFTFLNKHLVRMLKRIVYLYYLRDFNQGSLSLLTATPLLIFSTSFGAWKWWHAIQTHEPTLLGSMMVAVLPFIIGTQLFLNFLNYDVSNIPNQVLTRFETDKSESSS